MRQHEVEPEWLIISEAQFLIHLDAMEQLLLNQMGVLEVELSQIHAIREQIEEAKNRNLRPVYKLKADGSSLDFEAVEKKWGLLK